MKLPVKDQEVPLAEIKKICDAHGLHELWQKIENDPPAKPFKSDGCTLWTDIWQGIDLYPACFFHDLKYWCGYPGEYAQRLIADAELLIDVAKAGAPKMAEIMYAGVRAGGSEALNQDFSWGFGRVV